jgi:hypothetical protein
MQIIGTGCVDGVIVVIEIDGDASADDIRKEIVGILGVEVTVIEVSKGVFEISGINDATAQHLVDIIHDGMNTPILRNAKAFIKRDTSDTARPALTLLSLISIVTLATL